MKAKEILLYIHQLPQNIIGKVIAKGSEIKSFKLENWEEIKVHFSNKVFGSGVSLGNYIILDPKYLTITKSNLEETIKHENGHQIQSLYLGWFYLIIVGIPSAINNLTDRLFHSKWPTNDRLKWYFSRYPENWADKLGGVSRNFK